MVKRKQFDYFYFIEDGKLYPLDEVQELYEKNNGDISYFQGCMRCPECKDAFLSFTFIPLIITYAVLCKL